MSVKYNKAQNFYLRTQSCKRFLLDTSLTYTSPTELTQKTVLGSTLSNPCKDKPLNRLARTLRKIQFKDIPPNSLKVRLSSMTSRRTLSKRSCKSSNLNRHTNVKAPLMHHLSRQTAHGLWMRRRESVFSTNSTSRKMTLWVSLKGFH